MRWAALFRDFEAQWDEMAAAELGAEVAERSRIELARLRLVDRLRPAIGQPVSLRSSGAGLVQGRLSAVGPDWLLLSEAGGREALVPAGALLWVGGLGARSAEPGSEGQVAARLDLRHALRGVARDRAAVSVVLLDASTVSGTLDRVGADFIELAEHPPGEPRRAGAVRTVRTVPLSAVGLVRSG